MDATQSVSSLHVFDEFVATPKRPNGDDCENLADAKRDEGVALPLKKFKQMASLAAIASPDTENKVRDVGGRLCGSLTRSRRWHRC